jgi:hypothetical protein
MTSEAGLRATVRQHLAPYGRLVRLEGNPISGIPDLYFNFLGATGWLELKHLDRWPVRPRTPVRIESLRLEQVLWLEAETRARGRAFLLLQVGNEWLLLDTATVRSLWEGTETQSTLIERALVHGARTFPAKEIVRALRRKQEDLPS